MSQVAYNCLPRRIAGIVLDGPRGVSAYVMAQTSLSQPKHTTNMSSTLGPVHHFLCLGAVHNNVGSTNIAFLSLNACAMLAYLQEGYACQRWGPLPRHHWTQLPCQHLQLLGLPDH